MKKTIITALLLVLSTMTGVAQGAYSDLLNALYWSQNAANAGNSEQAAAFASNAFHGSGYNSGYGSGHSSYSYGTTITSAPSRKRTATNMSNVGLQINYSGYNRGAELARYYAEMRAERARLAAERRQRMVDSYMQTQYEKTQNMEASWQLFIANNSQAKPFSQEAINEFISNGLPGNVIIDDNGVMNMLPEALLEGAGNVEKSDETLEDRLRNMSDEEIDQFAEELYYKLDNEEELTDEEIDFLFARELERKARLEEDRKQLEETKRQLEEQLNSIMDEINNLNTNF